MARWIDDYNTEQLRSSLGYAAPAAFAAGFEQQRSGLGSGPIDVIVAI